MGHPDRLGAAQSAVTQATVALPRSPGVSSTGTPPPHTQPHFSFQQPSNTFPTAVAGSVCGVGSLWCSPWGWGGSGGSLRLPALDGSQVGGGRVSSQHQRSLSRRGKLRGQQRWCRPEDRTSAQTVEGCGTAKTTVDHGRLPLRGWGWGGYYCSPHLPPSRRVHHTAL